MIQPQKILTSSKPAKFDKNQGKKLCECITATRKHTKYNGRAY